MLRRLFYRLLRRLGLYTPVLRTDLDPTLKALRQYSHKHPDTKITLNLTNPRPNFPTEQGD